MIASTEGMLGDGREVGLDRADCACRWNFGDGLTEIWNEATVGSESRIKRHAV